MPSRSFEDGILRKVDNRDEHARTPEKRGEDLFRRPVGRAMVADARPAPTSTLEPEATFEEFADLFDHLYHDGTLRQFFQEALPIMRHHAHDPGSIRNVTFHKVTRCLRGQIIQLIFQVKLKGEEPDDEGEA
jgi:hypothetical protein